MIDGHHALSISRQAQLAGISRGSVYYLPKPVSAADLALMWSYDRNLCMTSIERVAYS